MVNEENHYITRLKSNKTALNTESRALFTEGLRIIAATIIHSFTREGTMFSEGKFTQVSVRRADNKIKFLL